MAIKNLNNNHFDTEEKQSVNSMLQSLESILSAKIKVLTPEDRKRYGSVSEQNKLIVNKVYDYYTNQPSMCAPDIDWQEFVADYDSRTFLEATILKLQTLADGLFTNKILHDYDNYQASLTDYGFAKYKAGANAPGFEKKASELSQFFNRTATNSIVPPTEN
jgi:hypothetical protein